MRIQKPDACQHSGTLPINLAECVPFPKPLSQLTHETPHIRVHVLPLRPNKCRCAHISNRYGIIWCGHKAVGLKPGCNVQLSKQLVR